MEQQSSTSKVTVEYFDPHDVYKLLAPGLDPRLPLHNLHWQSHAGPLRSIDTLHVELVHADDGAPVSTPASTLRQSGTVTEDGFQTQNVGGRAASTDTVDTQSLPTRPGGVQRRHQIPGLRRTPYLKVLFVRCDDNDSYKTAVRAEVREWVKTHTSVTSSSKKGSNQENHDAFEWIIVHVVLPNTVAATQPRGSSGGKSDTGAPERTPSTTSRWRTGSTPLLEKFRADFNTSGKGSADHVAQIRIGINDVPYDLLPRVVPAVPSGYSETQQDAENAWNDLIAKFKGLILSSFDKRVSQYEEDIKEKDAQRSLPGWNFCTFFILKEGLARGFENVGLVEDALVGYDELSVGLDSVINEQAQAGSPERHGGAMLPYTEELMKAAQKALAEVGGDEEDEAVDLQSKETLGAHFDEISISPDKKPYRDMILANNVSIFDFRCYIFARQIALLLRLGNALTSREDLLARLQEQQDTVLHGGAPPAVPPKHDEGIENLAVLAEVCRRTLQFIPSVSQVMRRDIAAAIISEDASDEQSESSGKLDPVLAETMDNLVASFAFSVAQQILAQTASKSLPVPPSSLSSPDDQKVAFPEPKTMMHPARTASVQIRPSSRPPPSPGHFPGPGRRMSVGELESQQASFLKTGMEELAARRAELYLLSRSILDGLGKKRGWSNGWSEAPVVGEPNAADMEDISLDDDASPPAVEEEAFGALPSGIESRLLRDAIDNRDDFYRLYEIMTDKAMRHYSVANQDHTVHSNLADLAVLKFHLKDYKTAASQFARTTPFFGVSGWGMLELSMLIMYSQCLSELEANEDYVRVTLKLLTKACAAEKHRLEQKSAVLLVGGNSEPGMTPLKGVVGKLFNLAKVLPTVAKVPLANFFSRIELVGAPGYEDKQDSCYLTFKLWSLLPEEVAFDHVSLKIASVDGGPCKEILFESKSETWLKPGKNTVKVSSNSIVPGKYRIMHLGLSSSNLFLQFDRDPGSAPSKTTDIFKDADVTLYQRNGGLDVQLSATKHTALDKNNSLDLKLSTGWNKLKSCEIRVKPATGGLRLLTTSAEVIDSSAEFTKPPEAGLFVLGSVADNTLVTIRFPYSVEQDVVDVVAKLEITFVTESDVTFYLAKSLAIPISLVLGVNVQDVFKHGALFSRFTVSAVTSSPLRLFKNELISSELFESSFGLAPQRPVTVFPKQPASLTYKITRTAKAKAGKRAGKTMYLKLYYSLLQTEIEDAISDSISEALRETPLQQYLRVVLTHVMSEVSRSLQPQDLERAALLGEVTTAFLAGVPWESKFQNLGVVPGSDDQAASKLSSIIAEWQQSHTRLPISTSQATEPATLLIPVEIPSLPILHTADLRLDVTASDLIDDKKTVTPTVCINQMIPATLHLKWTRVWDTDTTSKVDQEFSYEVNAPADTWLLGGRRKGHFIIPGASKESVSSTPETEAEIPLILIPLREGWLPYPTVDIKEVPSEDGGAAAQASEVDWRNLGETIRVVSERQAVTVSLDASGPGGGPLILESEASRADGGRIVA
ncbi:Trafficking protein particle complex subunit 10 [Paramyrothecium foliicola]|nr:Trafficking protein particle complex subunit 10 [Paramyrothecium foliicola]